MFCHLMQNKLLNSVTEIEKDQFKGLKMKQKI